MNPTVSINLCCYNSEVYLQETLESIAGQTFRDWELVVVNDGSTDSTEDIVLEFKRKGFPVIYHSQSNQGLGKSRNKALELSKGEFIAFIDHDDLWSMDKLEKQIPLFRNPRVAIVYSNAYILAGTKRRLYVSNKELHRGSCFRQLLKKDFMAMSSVVVRKAAVHLLPYAFDEQFHVVEDHDFLIRLAHEWEADFVDEPLATWRISSQGSTWTRTERFCREHEMMLKKYSELYKGFENKYANEIQSLRSRIAYEQSLVEWGQGNNAAVRKLLLPYLWRDKRWIVPFLFSFFPIGTYWSMLRHFGRYPE